MSGLLNAQISKSESRDRTGPCCAPLAQQARQLVLLTLSLLFHVAFLDDRLALSQSRLLDAPAPCLFRFDPDICSSTNVSLAARNISDSVNLDAAWHPWIDALHVMYDQRHFWILLNVLELQSLR